MHAGIALDTHYMLAKMQFGLRFVNLFVVKAANLT